MDETIKFEKLISSLITETLTDNIKWSIEKPPYLLTNSTDDFYPLFITALYRNTKIGLYEQRYKSYISEDEWSWSTRIGLCIYKDDYISYRYEKRSPALKDLFFKVAEKTSGIDNLIDW